MVSTLGYVGAGIVSFPRPDLSKYCQHLNLWEVSCRLKIEKAIWNEWNQNNKNKIQYSQKSTMTH